MTSDPFSAASYGGLFGSARLGELLGEQNRIRAMVEVEAALARAEAAHGVIPEAAGSRITAALGDFSPDLAEIGRGSHEAGVPVPALVAQLRRKVGAEHGAHVHWGATSQDILDTALVLVLRDVVAELSAGLEQVTESLAELAGRHRTTITLARTRMQQAAPTTFGLKVAGWRAPLVRAATRLAELTPRLLAVQFGGAAGTLAALGETGADVMDTLARELGLAAPAMPWHTQRDNLCEFAGWLSLVTGALGKFGLDVTLLAQNEIAELRESADPSRGGSSTLPQKSNPVLSEILVALARYNAGALSGMHQAMLHENERSGAGWALEWMVLPPMIMATGAALGHAREIAGGLVVDEERMRANIDRAQGFELAEAASFALAGRLPRDEARRLVEAACREAARSERHLIDVLAGMCEVDIDWPTLREPGNYLGSAARFVDRALDGSGS